MASVRVFERELGLAGTAKEVVLQAAGQLGVEVEGRPLVEVATDCTAVLGV